MHPTAYGVARTLAQQGEKGKACVRTERQAQWRWTSGVYVYLLQGQAQSVRSWNYWRQVWVLQRQTP